MNCLINTGLWEVEAAAEAAVAVEVVALLRHHESRCLSLAAAAGSTDPSLSENQCLM